jgi:hypothetical protein
LGLGLEARSSSTLGLGLRLGLGSSSTLSTPRVERVTACVAHRRGLAEEERGAGLGRAGLGAGRVARLAARHHEGHQASRQYELTD